MSFLLESTQGPSFCSTCLSTGRKLSSLGHYRDVYLKLFDGEKKNTKNLLICWECKAKLRNIVIFRDQVKNAEKLLSKCTIPANELLPTLSKLAIHNKQDEIAMRYLKINIPEITIRKTSIKETVEIKQEVVDTLKEEFDSDHELTFDAIDDIQYVDPDSIKKEIKLVNTDCKVKKKKKTKSENISLSKLKKPLTVEIEESKVKEWMGFERNSWYIVSSDFKCIDCAYGFKTEKIYRAHLKKHHNPELPHKCPICNQTFMTQQEMLDHKIQHTKLLKCAECGFTCMVKYHMQWHSEKHTAKFKHQPYQCSYCALLFTSVVKKQKHIAKTHREFACDDCGFTGPTKRVIEGHIMNKHSPRKCPHCNKILKTERIRREHIKTFHVIVHDENSYCVSCDMQFDNTRLYRRHLLSSVKHKTEVKGETPKKTYPCPECDKVYMGRYGMKNHYRLVHLKRTKYYCEQCNKYILNRTAFVRHQNKHLGIKLKKEKYCDICGRSFHNLLSKTSHWRHQKMHKGIKPKKDKICDFCGQCFSSNHILTNHKRTHTGERPYECPHCDAKFAQKTAMVSHIKHIHLKVERKRQ